MRESGVGDFEVDQNQPALDLSPPFDSIAAPETGDPVRTFEYETERDWPEGAVRKLGCGMFCYPDEYPDPTGRWQKRSPELKAAYQRVCSHMKKAMVRHRFKRGCRWIGREAHRLFKEGKVEIIAYV